jgi:hypothetical protein
MYAILHLPTGKLLERPHTLDYNKDLVAYDLDFKGDTLFYSKKEAEAYKRKFLIFYYLIIRHQCSFLKVTPQFPKRLPRFFKKRNRFKRWTFTYAAYDLGNRSLDFWLTTKTDNILTVSDCKEFTIINVKKCSQVSYEA